MRRGCFSRYTYFGRFSVVGCLFVRRSCCVCEPRCTRGGSECYALLAPILIVCFSLLFCHARPIVVFSRVLDAVSCSPYSPETSRVIQAEFARRLSVVTVLLSCDFFKATIQEKSFGLCSASLPEKRFCGIVATRFYFHQMSFLSPRRTMCPPCALLFCLPRTVAGHQTSWFTTTRVWSRSVLLVGVVGKALAILGGPLYIIVANMCVGARYSGVRR